MNNILMNAEMAKAILDGRKTQTRIAIIRFDVLNIDDDWQTIKFNDKKIIEKGEDGEWGEMDIVDFITSHSKYQKDEVIRVREPVKIDMCFAEEIHFHYLSDNKTSKLSIPKRFIKDGFAPDWMAHCNGVPSGCIKEMTRIFLKITDVRVERLKEISIDDICRDVGIIKNGYKRLFGYPNRIESKWIKLWNKTAPKGYKWEDNPHVFVYELERVNSNIRISLC